MHLRHRIRICLQKYVDEFKNIAFPRLVDFIDLDDP